MSQISTETTRAPNEPVWISKVDPDYAYGQTKLSEGTNKHCNFARTGGNLTGYFKFKRGFYGLSDITTIFQETTARTLNYQKPVWLDDKKLVTRRNKDKHREKFSKY